MTPIIVTSERLETVAAENNVPIEMPPGKPATARVGSVLYVAKAEAVSA